MKRKKYKEQKYKQKQEKERQRALRRATGQEKMSPIGDETRLKSVDTEVTIKTSEPPVTVSFVASRKGAHTQLVFSTGIVPNLV